MKRSERSYKSKRFLVISTTGIGDTLMGTPALRALRQSFPDSRIDLLIHSKRKELLFGNPHVTRMLSYRNNFFSRGLLFLKTLSHRYDSVLIFHANDDIWKLLRLIRFGQCYTRQGYKELPPRVIRLASLPRHSIQRRLTMVEKVGGQNLQDYRYDYFLPPRLHLWARERLAAFGVSTQDPLVGMEIGSADAFKCWPVEFFVEVAQYLRNKHQVKIYLNADKKEEDLVRQFRSLLGDGDVLHFPGTSLSQSAALIRACSLFISNDTGPMHMAIGLGVPVVGLFCPTDSTITGPLEYPRAAVIQKEITCHPCRVRDCPDNFCMKQISVEEVCRAADRLLNYDRRIEDEA
jgi:heptosyltransferase-2